MCTNKFILFCMGIVMSVSSSAWAGDDTPLYKDRTAPIEKRVDDLMSRMTLHEKVLQLQNRASGRLDEIDRIFLGESYGTTHEMSMSAYDCAVMYKEFCVVMFGLINVNILYYSFSTLYQMCNLRQSL